MWVNLRLPMDECDFFVRLVKLEAVSGAVIPNDDGTYSMYLNINDPLDKQLDTYWHEYEHIAFDDFDSDKDIAEIEARE